ncbi:MAG: Grx4 family monothiol glutaredoxin [Alphaproteobacteria bacterium GM202ARS2]|nr:Grx4 family monothiol glutaredoxin [Alphaproteobacteria bacterium GM202ARS2]
MTSTRDTLQKIIAENSVVLFMKGTPEMPMCGFSSVAAEILRRSGVAFHDVDVLKSQDIREGIKVFSDWPTIPQLYIKGEFVGGCDILKEMYQSGELRSFLKEKGIAFEEAAPS